MVNNKIVELCKTDYQKVKEITSILSVNLNENIIFEFNEYKQIKLTLFEWIHHSSNIKNIELLWNDLQDMDIKFIETQILLLIEHCLETVNIDGLNYSINRYSCLIKDKNIEEINKKIKENLYKIKNYKIIIKLLKRDIVDTINDYRTIDTILSLNEPNLFEHVENIYDFKNNPKVMHYAVYSLYLNAYQPENYDIEQKNKYKDILIYLIKNNYNKKLLKGDNFLDKLNKEREALYESRYFQEMLHENFKLKPIKNDDSLIDIVISDVPYFSEFAEIEKIWEKELFDNIIQENLDSEEKGKKRL